MESAAATGHGNVQEGAGGGGLEDRGMWRREYSGASGNLEVIQKLDLTLSQRSMEGDSLVSIPTLQITYACSMSLR